MTRDAIIGKIIARIDELNPFAVTDLNPSLGLIDNILDDSAKAFLLRIPVFLIHPTTMEITVHNEYQDGSGRIELPDDFFRLHTFKMDSWKRDVNEAAQIGTQKYRDQYNNVTRGGVAKPVVIIKSSTGGPKYLFYYSVDGGYPRTIETATYIPDPSVTSIEDALIVPLVWYVASEVLQVMGEAQASGEALKKMEQYITSLMH